MSRKKASAGKLPSAQSSSGEKLNLAQFGRFAEDARRINALKFVGLFEKYSDSLKAQEKSTLEAVSVSPQDVRRLRALQAQQFARLKFISSRWRIKARELFRALQTMDPTPFRSLADAIDEANRLAKDGPNDPLRTAILNLAAEICPEDQEAGNQFLQIPFKPFAKEVLERLPGLKIDERQMRRTCEDLGLSFQQAKTGRPKKNEQAGKLR